MSPQHIPESRNKSPFLELWRIWRSGTSISRDPPATTRKQKVTETLERVEGMAQLSTRNHRASKERKTVVVATISPEATSLYFEGMIYSRRCAILLDTGATKTVMRPDMIGGKRLFTTVWRTTVGNWSCSYCTWDFQSVDWSDVINHNDVEVYPQSCSALEKVLTRLWRRFMISSYWEDAQG